MNRGGAWGIGLIALIAHSNASAGEPTSVPVAPELTAAVTDPLTALQPPPPGLVDLRAVLPGARFDIRYHTADNFTGAPLPGYGAPGAWLVEAPARALAAVQEELAPQGLLLLIYDAYRPHRGTLAMVAWAERTDQVHLLDDGYIARRSGHNRGNTVDLTLADGKTGTPLDMGTPWDTLTEASHTANAEGDFLMHRLRLKEVMERHGFRGYAKEWWHFGYPSEASLPLRDAPYGCFEPPEGEWIAPDGWGAPGWPVPLQVDITACPPPTD